MHTLTLYGGKVNGVCGSPGSNLATHSQTWTRTAQTNKEIINLDELEKTQWKKCSVACRMI